MITSHFLTAAKAVVHDSDREAWLKARRTMLTASQFAAVLGEDPYRDALSVWVEKTMPDSQPEAEPSIDDPRFWGRRLEQTVLRSAADHYRWDYHPGGWLLQSNADPRIGTTIDAEIDRHDGLGWVPFECKNTELSLYWDQDTQDCPRHVIIQCQAQTMVTRTPECVCFALLSRYTPVRITIPADERFHELLHSTADEFWKRVAKLDPYPATALSRPSLSRMFAKELPEHTSVQLSPDAVAWTAELAEIANQMKSLEERQEELRNLIRQAIGKATFGVLPSHVDGKSTWRWLTQKRASYVVPAGESRVLSLIKNPVLPKGKQ